MHTQPLNTLAASFLIAIIGALAHNMNRVIGTVLVFSAIFQFCKSI